jgi:anti-anti-sigma factor
MPASIALEQRDDAWILTVSGELDYAECAGFRMYIDRILKAMPNETVVDFSSLDYLDSSGLGLLLSLAREYADAGGRLAIVTNATVTSILEITRLSGIFTTASSVDGALAKLAQASTAN